MNLQLELSSLSGLKITGIGVYVKNLIENLKTHQDVNIRGSYRISRFKSLENIKKTSQIQELTPIINNLNFLTLPKFDVFHGPDYWLPNFPKAKKVVTIHDFSVFHDGLWHQDFAQKGRKSITHLLKNINPQEVIVVSDFVKNELIERFPEYENKVTTIYHGTDHFKKTLTSKTSSNPYIICVGTIEKRKNQALLGQAFKKISSKYPDIKLIFVGSDWGFSGTEISSELSKIKNVEVKNYLSKDELDILLCNALFAVYPSIYEGFGFPILEAMNMEVPMFTSNFGAMKEIAGEAAALVNTQNVNEFAEKLEFMIENESYRNQLSQKGKIRASEFTWAKCATQTIEVYKKAISE